MPATKIVLRCGDCSEGNYYTEKNRQNVSGSLTLKKHCPRCRKHTEHQESRVKK